MDFSTRHIFKLLELLEQKGYDIEAISNNCKLDIDKINKFIKGKRTSSFYANRNNQKKKTEDIDFIEIKITYYY